ncbi:MAG: hypothetical protein Q7V04_07600, partial [Deltaproteobacteria bacterium]|nr:hypothetical protein [Deltaproteobacteria bacterium]
MSKSQYTSMFSIRARMIVISLVVAAVVGGVFTAIDGAYSLLAAIMAAFFSSLLCAAICGRLVAELRMDQSRLLAECARNETAVASQPESDDLKALFSGTEISLQSFKSHDKRHQEL